jgi:hypothetical protein
MLIGDMHPAELMAGQFNNRCQRLNRLVSVAAYAVIFLALSKRRFTASRRGA